MGRILSAVFLGLLAGGFCVGLIQSISISQHPMPEGTKPGTPEFKEWIAALPVSAIVIVEVAHFVGSLVGGFIATKIAPANAPRLALVVGCVMLTFGILNLLSIPHPLWCWGTLLLVYIPPALLGARLATKLDQSLPAAKKPQ